MKKRSLLYQMVKTVSSVIYAAFLLCIFSLVPTVYAQGNLADQCPETLTDPTNLRGGEFSQNSLTEFSVSVAVSDDMFKVPTGTEPDDKYVYYLQLDFFDGDMPDYIEVPNSNPANYIKPRNFESDARHTFTFRGNASAQQTFNGPFVHDDDNYTVSIWERDTTSNNSRLVCRAARYEITEAVPYCDGQIRVYQNRLINGEIQSCYAPYSCIANGQDIIYEFSSIKNSDGTPYNGEVAIVSYNSPYNSPARRNLSLGNATNGVATLTVNSRWLDWLDRPVNITNTTWSALNLTSFQNCNIPLIADRNQAEACPSDSCSTTPPPASATEATVFELCEQIPDLTLKGECEDCMRRFGSNGRGIWTAVGCINTEPKYIIEAVIRIGIGLGGGVALIMTLVGGFLLTTSQGNPKQAEQAKEMITSAVIGILFVLFSVVMLQFIGVTVMQLPGFGTS